MFSLKRVFLISVSFGAGFAIIFFIVMGSIFLYQAQPKPWNTNAITASYKSVDTEGKDNLLIFYYTLTNNTKYDYNIEHIKDILLASKLEKNKEISVENTDDMITIDPPIFIPAYHRLYFMIHIRYPVPKKTSTVDSKEEREKYRKEIEAYINKEFPNLDGFVLFDKKNHYKIEFPKGW